MFNSICRLLPPKVDNSGRLPTRSASWRCIGTQVVGRQQYTTTTINGRVCSSNYCAKLLVIRVRNYAATWLRCAPACMFCPNRSPMAWKHFRHVGSKSNAIFTAERSDGSCTKREEISHPVAEASRRMTKHLYGYICGAG